jgi:hypothetical protein
VIQKIPERTKQPFDLVTYLLRADKGYVIGNTFVTRPLTPQTVLAELNTYRELNPKVEHLVSHMSLRLAPGEHLTDAQFRAIAAEYLRGLGYGDCPYFVARHTDASSEHIHIVVSRIGCLRNLSPTPESEGLRGRVPPGPNDPGRSYLALGALQGRLLCEPPEWTSDLKTLDAAGQQVTHDGLSLSEVALPSHEPLKLGRGRVLTLIHCGARIGRLCRAGPETLNLL